MTAIGLGILLALLTILLTYSTLNPSWRHIRQECLSELTNHHNNKTVHIVHEDETWTKKQLDYLEYIINVYNDYKIHILIFNTNKTSEQESTTENVHSTQECETTTGINKDKTKYNNNDSNLLFFDSMLPAFNAFQFFEKLKNNIKFTRRSARNTENATKENKNDLNKAIKNASVEIEKTTYEQYFSKTPLYHDWVNLDSNMLLFAAKVQEIWQYGGISFYLPPNLDNNTTNIYFDKVNDTSKNTSKNDLQNKDVMDISFRALVLKSRSIYEKLPLDLVTIDKKGFHMASKTPCHSFFGEIMTKLMIQKKPLIIEDIIQKTLKEFCKRRAVNEEDCKLL